MKHLNKYNSFLQIREGLERGLEKFIHLKKFFKFLGKTEGDDLAKSLSRLADNLGDDAALKLEQLMGKVITGKNARKIGGKYNLISESGAKYPLETINMIIDAILTGKKTYEEVRHGLPSVLSDGLKFKEELGTILKSRKPKAASTKIKPAAEEGALPPKSTDDFIIGQKKIPLTEEQITQTFQDQQDVYNKLRSLEDWNKLKGVLEKVDDKQDVLNQLEKIGFGPDTAVRSKAFIEAIGEKNLVSFWNDMVVMKDSFKDMTQSELMKLIEQRMTRIETKSIGSAATETDKKSAWSKLKPDRERRQKLWKWTKWTLGLSVLAFWMYKCKNDGETEKPELVDIPLDNNTPEGQSSGGSVPSQKKKNQSLKDRNATGKKTESSKLVQDAQDNKTLPGSKKPETTGEEEEEEVTGGGEFEGIPYDDDQK